jgi:hypothetical protein
MQRIFVLLMVTAVSLMLTVMLTGCGAQEPEPVEKKEAAPPPETAEQLFDKELKPLSELLSAAAAPESPDILGPQKEEFLKALGGAKSKVSAKENGRPALSRLQSEVESHIKTGRDQQKWMLVKACCQAFTVLSPGNDMYAKQEQRADLLLKRPDVAVRGFVTIGSDLYAFLDVTNKETGEKKNFKVREGEEFYGTLRLVRIIGDQQAIEILYIPINDTWTVNGIGQ